MQDAPELATMATLAYYFLTDYCACLGTSSPSPQFIDGAL